MSKEWLVPTIDMQRCTGCGLCVTYCPVHAVEMISLEGKRERPVIVRPQDCAYCGMCEEICPQEAIALFYEVTPVTGDWTGDSGDSTDRAY